MKPFSRIRPLALISAAVFFAACSDGTGPSSSPDAATSTERSANAPQHTIEIGSISTVDFPGATTTLPFAINNDGVIVGRYLSAGRTHGFIRTADGQFTTIDFPGSGFTVASAINNDGDVIAGWYTLPASASIRRGFVLRDGVFSTIDPPGSIFNNILGLNERGDIVGRFCIRTPCREPGSGDFHGLLLSDDEFTVLDVPGSIETNAWSINSRGEILGGFGRAGGGVELFLYRQGDFTTITPPAGKFFSEDNGGINSRGDIVGKYCNSSPCLIGPSGNAFVLINGRFTTLEVPGSRGGAASDINESRDVVGGYFDSAGVLHGYVLHLDATG